MTQGAAGAGLAVVFYGATVVGVGALLGAVLIVQLLIVVGVLRVLDAPAATGSLAIGVAAAIAADVAVAADGRTSGLAGVTALAFVASLLHELARRGRTRVTESLADTVVLVVLVCAVACLSAAQQQPDGPTLVRLTLAAVGGALLVGRLADAGVRRPLLRAQATRGWPGTVLALAAGVGSSALANSLLVSGLAGQVAVVLGAGVAATAMAADLLCDLAPTSGRRAAVVMLVLPFAAVGPVALLASRWLAA